ncbi:hypothetical protein HUO13_27210 [Saccharopolyspora erythraea]|uniref:hypothetical protein n=1 Tax=Saccharopolyspora erythraea TaxID=1836 RepID=UPI001BAA287D|nr:hypothetical protein [Saccharopolyspora erythraea]QUH04016.1 hypothetical protein HUO13_27210 [Saccharopolyspora erythraea]
MEGHSLVRSKDDELDEVLRGLGGARLYRNNIFRLTGLPVTASTTQVRRRREEAALTARLGTPLSAPGELPLTPMPDWDAVDTAFESMRNPVLRLVHELLWLWDAGEEDQHDYAVRQHCGVIEGASLTAPGRPDMANDPLGQQWLVALQAWAQVLSGEQIWDRARQRVKEIDDPRLTTGTVRRLRHRLPRHIVDVHLALAVRAAEELGAEAADRHMWLLDESTFDDDLIDAALRDAVRPAEERVRAACEAANRVTETAPRDAIDAGHVLLEQTAAPLRTIAGMLSGDDPVTAATHDEVARSLNLCAVAHHNETDARGPALGVLSSARALARESTTIELIDRNTTVIAEKRVLSEIDDLCKAGKVNTAADRLRAWRRHADDEPLRQHIDAVLANPAALLTPPKGLPVQGSFFGWGAYLMGRRETTEPGKFLTTHYLTVFFIPVFPMAVYLRDAMYVYGKVPMSMPARWWRLVALLLVAAAVTQPFQDLPRLLVFLAIVAGAAAVLGLRRYRLNEWAAAQADG